MKTDLTAKQLEFCKQILLGEYQMEAYMMAYDCENMEYDTVKNEASKLMKNKKIIAFINNVRKRELLGTLRTRETYLNKLDDIIDSDESTMGEKIQAINTISKLKLWDKRTYGEIDLNNINENVPSLEELTSEE